MTGEELTRWRLSKKYSQRKLGELLGYEGKVAEDMVYAWEHNRRPIPLKHIRKLSELLEVPIDKFIP